MRFPLGGDGRNECVGCCCPFAMPSIKRCGAGGRMPQHITKYCSVSAIQYCWFVHLLFVRLFVCSLFARLFVMSSASSSLFEIGISTLLVNGKRLAKLCISAIACLLHITHTIHAAHHTHHSCCTLHTHYSCCTSHTRGVTTVFVTERRRRILVVYDGDGIIFTPVALIQLTRNEKERNRRPLLLRDTICLPAPHLQPRGERGRWWK